MHKILFFLLAVSIACQAQTAQQNAKRQENPLTPGINQKRELAKIERYLDLFDYRVIKNELRQNGYALEKRFNKQLKAGKQNDTAESAVLLGNGKTLLTFDKINHPAETVDIGLFPFLSKTDAQMFVSQTAPRVGCHWIISTKPQPQVLFESAQFDVGREDFQILDLDADGVYELSFESVSFYGFEPERLGHVGAPLTEIIFKYDSQTNKYAPANAQFADFVLREIENQKTKIRRDHKDWQFADVLAIMLRYVYAGRETDAWNFFDREYNLADKNNLKTKIKVVLNNDRTYQYLYGAK